MTNTTQETPEETFERIYGHVISKIDERVFDSAKEYHTARLKIEQSQPVKSLQECKDEVARREEFKNWEHLKVYAAGNKFLVNQYELWSDEAAELYAQQFQPKTVSDEEIEAAFPLSCGLGLIAQADIKRGAKWMREKLTGK